jgi:hypothetical protein
MRAACGLSIATVLITLSLWGCGNVGSSTAPTMTGNWVISVEELNRTVLDGNGNPTYTTINSWAYLSQQGTSISGIVQSNLCYPASTVFQVDGQLQNNKLRISPLAAFSAESGTFTLNAEISTDLSTIQGGDIFLPRGCNPALLPTVTGRQIPSLAGNWTGTLTSVSGPSASVSLILIQTSPNANEFPTLSGNATFSNSPCFMSGTLTGNQAGVLFSGTIATTNGTLQIPQIGTDHSYLASDNLLSVSYSVQGGTCNGDYAQGTLTRQ